MISKELLGKVLNVKVLGNLKCPEFVLYFDVDLGTPTTRTMGVNIYELAHKCKEWAFDNHVELSTWKTTKTKDTSYGKAKWETHDFGNTYYVASTGVRYTHGNTEPESIFKICQWILDNKDTK